ncbi:hypothetical protein [Lacinutrix sp. Hel_I_90]|nr:hypothetical protein [Lacinutrix sp. Hel_I_90]
MKAIINTLRTSQRITNDRLCTIKGVYKFRNTKDGLWRGVTRYAH